MVRRDRFRPLLTHLLAGLFACATCAGCGVDFAYLLPAVAGQIDILLHTVPIEQAIADGNLSDEQVRKLVLVQDSRNYARDVIGLNVGDHYTRFYNAGDDAVAYNLSASRRDRFEPYVWTFPLVGSVPFLGFFDLAPAELRADELRDQGYDVFIYEVDAYYALGIFSNPILSPMLERPDESLIDTVIHELTHATMTRFGDTDFNESLATFVGRTGALAYLKDRYAAEPERQTLALARFEDNDRYSAFALELYQELDAYYRSDLPAEAKILGREAIYQAGRERFAAEVLPLMNIPENYAWVDRMPANNAFMLGIRRYNLDLAAFDAVFQAVNRDWSRALEVFAAAARADDAYAFLHGWVAGDPAVHARVTGLAGAVSAPDFTGHSACCAHRATTFIPE